ncbi:TetR/AcrR family transcriptional regulator [Marinibacterium profundimaris]|uniref:TetR family transcriptional regulator n=1 Tax=Marinibacterium profundimaris TaxID=1679460 RepID=A0A225ND47_9RHOB|nr:TetR/AcrR family transcriptional regulator [Marinibacterium profundimaris]OWU69030.1 TetR family transcriptional regulator [Marinibacterium profundimaris]
MARTAGSHSDITGPRIREAALRLFAEHGYAAVSMRQIAAEVGVQAGALYNYTADKQSLLAGLMRGHLEELLAERAAEETGPDPLARLDAFTRFHIRYHLERPEAVFIAYMELRNLSPDNFREIEVLRHAYETELETVLQDGVAQGVFDVPDPKVATLAVIAMLTGVTTWYRDTGRLSRDEVAETYCGMVRRLVGC